MQNVLFSQLSFLLNCSHSLIQSALAECILGISHMSGNRAMKTTGTDPVLVGFAV